MNFVYEHLVKGVFKRPWAKQQHPALQPFAEERDFFLILQEIAVAIWHGNGRAATRAEIMSRCQSGTLERLFSNLQVAAADGVTRLLTAFYFRKSGDVGRDEAAFEFSHKSFGEYLTSRRIVHQIKITAEERQRNRTAYSGWSEQDSLKHWIMLCGPKPIDEDLFRFVRREVSLASKSKGGKSRLGDWQSAFDGLLSWGLRHGMPMQVIENPKTFREQVLWARNSEEALLACGFALAVATQKVRLIEWPDTTSLGLLLNRIRGQRNGPRNVLGMNCLGFLKADQQYLDIADLFGANLEASELRHVEANYTILVRANLRKAHLNESSLFKANLEGASLMGANLERAKLEGASLMGAHLEGASLMDANLEDAKLEGAHLKHANLEGANLKRANLERANLKRAHLKRAHLEGASLMDANLEGANLEGANLEGAKLEGAKLEGANLKRAKLEGTYLQGRPIETARS
jgi:uncharacterized protein YjbI with pentapeptide repeats